MSRLAAILCAATGLGLAIVPAPFLLSAQGHAQTQGQHQGQPQGQAQSPTPAASIAQDLQCFVLLQQRREAIVADTQTAAAQNAEVINNLTIISAFYAGRISEYSTSTIIPGFATATTAIASATPEQRDAFASQCVQFYLGVMDVLGAARP